MVHGWSVLSNFVTQTLAQSEALTPSRAGFPHATFDGERQRGLPISPYASPISPNPPHATRLAPRKWHAQRATSCNTS